MTSNHQWFDQSGEILMRQPQKPMLYIKPNPTALQVNTGVWIISLLVVVLIIPGSVIRFKWL